MKKMGIMIVKIALIVTIANIVAIVMIVLDELLKK